MTTITRIEKRSLDAPDETREFPGGRMEMITLGDVVFGRAVFEPGWRWSESVKPIAQTESCEFEHAVYCTSGSMKVRMDDGEELELTPGDVAVIPPGHDGWVTSDEPCVMYDFGGTDLDYAKPK
ncbi:MAG TPA: cupin domain-containing protein [Acidimicrobiia bacterium]|nr:cupin domain-containing protein [Acidimicrobiia bacterium]